MPLPALCADRIDCTIRDVYHFGLVTLNEIQEFINELDFQNGKIGVRSEKAALWIVDKYIQLNNDYFRKRNIFLPIQNCLN